MNYSIDTIKVNNFKVFTDYTASFSGNHMVVFSGPNGFGKTTIFDALELAFTGNIDRFKNIESATGCDDVLVSRDQGKPVTVEVTLSSHKQKLKIIRSLKKEYLSTTGNKVDKKAANFSTLWQLSVAVGDDAKLTTMAQADLEKILGQKELSRYYNLFYYVRQEDTSHFLKRSEKDRLSEISRLFDTIEEESVLKKLEGAKKRLIQLKKSIEDKKNELKTELKLDDSAGEGAKFIKLFPLSDHPWDAADPPMENVRAKDNITTELQRIRSLVTFRDEFILNRKFLHVLAQGDTLLATLHIGTFLNDLDDIVNTYELKISLDQHLSLLDVEKLVASDTLNVEVLSAVVPELDIADLQSRVAELKEAKGQTDATASICQQLLDIRSKLLAVFEEGVEEAKAQCPLCGYNWGNHSTLLNEIEKKTESLSAFLSKEQGNFQNGKKNLEKEILAPAREVIKRILGDKKFHISKSAYESVINHRSHLDMVKRLLKWFSDNGIVASDLIFENRAEEIDSTMIVNNLETLKNRIKEKIPPLSEDYQVSNQEYRFESVYRSYFNAYDKLLAITCTDIDAKIKYIESVYASGLENKRKLFADYEKQLSVLEKLDKRFKLICDLFKSEIGRHRKAIIKDIEIPFYIYSGKILQSIREGSTGGVFIKDPSPGEELKNIRFVSDWKSDHDVINTTSSGQLSGIIIALTLAMNKVYSKGLMSIFIDDPVQTMDDINIVSLVDLLRHDFKDKQVFLSTHEDDFERYVLYKYLVQNKNVKKINVMTRREYSNTAH